jgi:8-oxo-dGTP diphosphatase
LGPSVRGDVTELRAGERIRVTDRGREGTSAVLISTDGRLILQIRDNFPHISDPGKLGFFGGQREGNESFLDCVVREVHEEIGYYLPPERFELIGRYFGPDYRIPFGMLRGEIFVARDVPVDLLTITEGSLRVIEVDEIDLVYHMLAIPAKYALKLFLAASES